MRIAQYVLLVLLSFIAAGCGPGLVPCSEHPLFSDDVLAAEPSLEGTWTLKWTFDGTFGKQLPRERATVTLKKKRDGVYDMVHTEGEDRITGVAHLVRLDDQLYLDVEPQRVEGPLRNLLGLWGGLQGCPKRTHWQFRIAVKHDKLGVSAPQPGGLQAISEQCKLPTRQVGGQHDWLSFTLLTASTKQLQDLYRKHGDDLFDATQSAALYERKPAGKSSEN